MSSSVTGVCYFSVELGHRASWRLKGNEDKRGIFVLVGEEGRLWRL